MTSPTIAEPPGVAHGTVRNPRASHEPKLYDFRRPSKLNRGHVRKLHMTYETFCRQFTTVLTSTVRVFSLVELVAVEQMPYVDYIESIPTPSFLALTSIEPLAGTAVLQIPHKTAMLCVDRLLGGPGTPEQPERLFTEIETKLMRSLSQRVLHELRYAFDGMVSLTPEVVGVEANPQFAQAAAPSDVYVVASFEMNVGNQEGLATFAMPFTGLYPVLEAAATPKRNDRRDVALRSAAALHARLSDVPVDVAVEFSQIALTPREILSLAVGDVLPLRHPTNSPLRITSGGMAFAYGVPGSTGKHVACRVVEDPEPQEGTTNR
ncbi:MAG TPA: FliM/FliN family flagellar motor switch protein [Acidothermaceae bacterium]